MPAKNEQRLTNDGEKSATGNTRFSDGWADNDNPKIMKTSVLEMGSPATRGIIAPLNSQQILPTGGIGRPLGIRVKSILVPVDFSKPSEAALVEAVRVANRFASKITLVHVVPSVETKGRRFRLALQRVCDEHKSAFKRLIQEKGIGPELVDHSLVLQGQPFNQITALARSMKTDLIVIATHGYGAIKRFMLGSTTERVVRYAPCPVLVARNHLREREVLRLRNILVPLDFSECSLNALRYAGVFAREFGAKETLLHVVHPVYHFMRADFDTVAHRKLLHEMHAAGGTQLLRLSSELQDTGLKLRRVIRCGHPATEIIKQAAADKSDLIAISTHGCTGFKHAWLGSVAENVVRLAPCDVLVVRQLEHEFV
ncbi:MAG: universal stress protein [Limisphaerales bacterium]